uniref:Uncharacterized protein n=1 Tax=Meloidogyne enterolobii TaxID=390850 RepID=A0A6V7X6A4_MELEN|nr:unnamed protein product [Meloidogyne enterolobii]
MNSQIIRNNSSNSLTNSSLTYQNNNDGNKTLCSGSIMNIPNGVFHPIAAKRSYVGINNGSNGSNNGLNQNNQSFLPLLYQQQQQQQSSRSPLYTAALTNLQHQQIDSFPLINQPLINQQSKKNSSSNNLFIGPKIAMSTATAIAVAIPPFSQTSGGGSCGGSLAGDSTNGVVEVEEELGLQQDHQNHKLNLGVDFYPIILNLFKSRFYLVNIF